MKSLRSTKYCMSRCVVYVCEENNVSMCDMLASVEKYNKHDVTLLHIVWTYVIKGRRNISTNCMA